MLHPPFVESFLPTAPKSTVLILNGGGSDNRAPVGVWREGIGTVGLFTLEGGGVGVDFGVVFAFDRVVLGKGEAGVATSSWGGLGRRSGLKVGTIESECIVLVVIGSDGGTGPGIKVGGVIVQIVGKGMFKSGGEGEER